MALPQSPSSAALESLDGDLRSRARTCSGDYSWHSETSETDQHSRCRAATCSPLSTLEIALELEQAARRSGVQGFTENARIIARDVPRTFPGVPEVDNIRMQLAELLRSYAQKDPELGYTQGMSFAAAIVCIGRDAQSAAQAFDQVMFVLRKLWMPGFPMVMEGAPVFQQIMEERDPELSAHLHSICFVFEMVIPKVWLSIFCKVGAAFQLDGHCAVY